MAIGFVLFNQTAGNQGSFDTVKEELGKFVTDEMQYQNICEIKDYKTFFDSLGEEDYVILVGGDGTVNRFANDVHGLDIKNEILYFPNGTGNDFARDVEKAKENGPFPITEYLKDLPSVTVNGETHFFINGIGYGIDGYCCEVGDKLKAAGQKNINYAGIAIKGLLFHYKRTSATVTVDGVSHSFKHVWLAPAMNGRFYGGGMMPTPDQKRNSGELSVMVFTGMSKIKTLAIFPSIFKGEHVKHKDVIHMFKGKEVTVTFDRPTALQIDGETILGVTTYTASAAK